MRKNHPEFLKYKDRSKKMRNIIDKVVALSVKSLLECGFYCITVSNHEVSLLGTFRATGFKPEIITRFCEVSKVKSSDQKSENTFYTFYYYTGLEGTLSAIRITLHV